jgi:hypothetical protein
MQRIEQSMQRSWASFLLIKQENTQLDFREKSDQNEQRSRWWQSRYTIGHSVKTYGVEAEVDRAVRSLTVTNRFMNSLEVYI